MINKNILVPIADGIEELEAITIIDVLRRAGLAVRVSSIGDKEIVGANGIRIVADSEFIDEVVEDYDAIILPGGGKGAHNFAIHAGLNAALKQFAHEDDLIGAICASPAVVLNKAGLLNNKKATCYPSFKHEIKNYVDQKVVVDGNIITSQGPGTALAFSLKIAEILVGEHIANQVKADMLV